MMACGCLELIHSLFQRMQKRDLRPAQRRSSSEAPLIHLQTDWDAVRLLLITMQHLGTNQAK